MRFLTMVKGVENAGQPPQSLFEAIGKLGEEATIAGVLVETGALGPSELGARIRIGGGKLDVTDGSFGEGTELVGGYAVYEVGSKDEALHWARKFAQLHADHWPEWTGEVEIREVVFRQ